MASGRHSSERKSERTSRPVERIWKEPRRYHSHPLRTWTVPGIECYTARHLHLANTCISSHEAAVAVLPKGYSGLSPLNHEKRKVYIPNSKSGSSLLLLKLLQIRN